jgi:hypothetical protein
LMTRPFWKKSATSSGLGKFSKTAPERALTAPSLGLYWGGSI